MKRIYIITGASRGIGKELLKHYKQNFEVLGISRTKVSDDNLVIDISKKFEVDPLIEVVQDFDELVLVNCAGLNYNSFLHKSDEEKWVKVIETNLIGLYRIVRVLTPLMREKKWGRIINLSSVTAQVPTPGVSAYVASKSALWGLARTFSAENASLNVSMNNINLGYTNMGMINEVPQKYLDAIIASIPKGELGDAESIIKTIDYIIDNQFIHGASVNLNGGLV